ncbi:GNAT family N-acetyltransferase [Paenibacillus harenae]|uniref:GNAT family N-acetyltransferase n=1 Tax=Paenibacillus harenae TaxID=306543 RepID=UPI002791283F|nr:GNAT family N-acetyltransferase [Paenibacillus harenae]MDQ0063922.1 putative acetyltransferase [Paenibacillus harenae]
MERKIEIVQMNEEQYEASIALSQFAFQYVKSSEEIQRTKEQYRIEPAIRWAALVDGQLAAQATVLELHTYIGGSKFAMGGVAGVATWPEHRRQGLVARLLVHTLEEMRNRGQSVSFLHPFAFAFYRKFGWETYTEFKSYTIRTDQLPARQAIPGRIERVSIDDSVHTIGQLYETYASKYNGTLARTDLWWEYRVNKRKPGQTAVYYDAQNSPQGYIRYEVKNSQMTVHEFVHLNEEARNALWSFIAQHDSMIERVSITVPSDDLLPFLLNNPRIQHETIPYFMARIVDAAAFVEQYHFDEDDCEDQIAITIKDEHAPWNNGSYMLTIEKSGKASLVSYGSPTPNNGNGSIELGIGTLTTLLLGYVSTLQLYQYGRVQGEESIIKRLQKRIPERTTYLADFF